MNPIPKWLKIKKNPNLVDKIFKRQKIIQLTRDFFLKNGFTEVETPLLRPSLIPESYLEVFETYLLNRSRQKKKMYLSTSPEASIKKLLVAGIGNCFEITRCFRNTETGSKLHNPEFTMIEWYRIGATYKEIMKDCENWFIYLFDKLAKNNSTQNKHKKIIYQKYEIDLTPPWERISVTKAFFKYANIDLDKALNHKSLIKIAFKKNYKVTTNTTWEQIFNQIFLNEIEPHLGTEGKPTIIYDYPAQLAALSKLRTKDNRYAERFELYIGGLELGDCYTELTDLKQQRQRFNTELTNIKRLRRISIKSDDDFLYALKEGLPKCAGIAVGLDRVAMLFTNSSSLDDVIYFPSADWL